MTVIMGRGIKKNTYFENIKIHFRAAILTIALQLLDAFKLCFLIEH